MLDCISVENMRCSDSYTIRNFTPSKVLMYRAAYGVFLAGSWNGKTAIVVGSGNNGGDGYALAWILAMKGYECTVFMASVKRSEDGQYYHDLAKNKGVGIEEYHPGCLSGYNQIVDCLLGTGFSGELRENLKVVVEEINRTNATVISVDINSGMNGDNGEYSCCVHSSLTVTVGYMKKGFLQDIGEVCGKVVCCDIGIRLLEEEYKVAGEQESELIDDITIMKAPYYMDLKVIDVSKVDLPTDL